MRSNCCDETGPLEEHNAKVLRAKKQTLAGCRTARKLAPPQAGAHQSERESACQDLDRS